MRLPLLLLLLTVITSTSLTAQSTRSSFKPGELWPDDKGVHINAHGGGILYHDGVYYWFGEHKGERSNAALVGVTCYASTDLYNWENKGVALSVVDDPASPLARGCIIERPKVIYNTRTKTFVMYFHHELRFRGYDAAHVGVAVSKQATGPYTFLHSCRPNAGFWPANMPTAERDTNLNNRPIPTSWTPEWIDLVKQGLFVRRDFKGGQMSRDMTLFVDDDGKAYHIYSSEENLTLHIAELSDDYLSHTGHYVRVAPAGHNEAPAIFKKGKTYYMITSGCTGWDPNAARLFTAKHIMGPWTQHPNPWKGEQADISFDSQSTFIFKVEGRKDTWIFMADRWRPRHPSDGRYIWFPIEFEKGLPVLTWRDGWSL